MNIETITAAFAEAPEAVAQAAIQKTNHPEAEVDANGYVWVRRTGSGHWMGDDALISLAKWIESEYGQSLAKFCGVA